MKDINRLNSIHLNPWTVSAMLPDPVQEEQEAFKDVKILEVHIHDADYTIVNGELTLRETGVIFYEDKVQHGEYWERYTPLKSIKGLKRR